MPIPRQSLKSFLTHARSTLRTASPQHQKLTIVVGNESADLDSLTSSLLYAYIRSLTQPTLHIPMLNIPRTDLALRPEFTALLPHVNLDASYLITLSDLPSPSSSFLERTAFILVDHNSPTGPLRQICKPSHITGVIDHHHDEHFVPPSSAGTNPRIVEKAGSCSSLVTNHLRPAWDALSASSLSSGASHAQHDDASLAAVGDDEAIIRTWDAQVAKLALASILIDTRNLQDGSKTTEHDINAVRYLEAKIAAAPAAQIAVRDVAGQEGRDRLAFFKQIDDAKKDIDGLALEDILRKDYKQWDVAGRRLGISSVVKPLRFLAGKASHETSTTSSRNSPKENHKPLANEAFLKATHSFATSRNLSFYAVMTSFTPTSTSTSSDEGTFQRELFVRTFDASGTEAVQRFEKTAAEELQLRVHPEWPDGTEGGEGETSEACTTVWCQGNAAASRKRVAPLLREALR